MKYLFLLVYITLISGCAEIATSIATQAGVQYVGEKYLISQKSPVIKCNAFNVLKGNKFCRVNMVYQVSYSPRKI